MSANDVQVGGDHYRSSIQHWDYVVANDLDYFQGQITRYVTRWRKKDGLEDLYKARHFLEKYIELQEKSSRFADPEDTMSMSLGLEEGTDGRVLQGSCSGHGRFDALHGRGHMDLGMTDE